MNSIIIDLETIKATKQTDINYLISHIKPAAACKSDEAKAKSIAKQKSEVVDKSVFDGAFGEIITIGFCFDDEKITSLQRTDTISEKKILQEFFDILKDFAALQNKPTNLMSLKWVAHNAQFDLPFLWKRCVINNINTHGIKIPQWARHNTQDLFCTLTEWRGFGAKAGGSLDCIAHVLGLTGKDGVDGAMAWGMWQSKQYEDIARYCESDVQITREIYKRMIFKDKLSHKLSEAA